MKFDSIYHRIRELFEYQVKNGKQSLGIDEFAACGQFINRIELAQRGLHGTSAAIYVLSQKQEYDDLTNKLCEYYEEIHRFLVLSKLQSAENNTIKQSEILYALSFVKAGTRDVSALKNKIAENLLANIYNKQGWDYILNESKEVQLLSTAHALKGLIKAGFYNKLDNVINYFKTELKEKSQNHIDNPTRLSIYLFCLYVLVFYDDNYKNYEKECKTIFSNIKKSKYFSLNHSYEQNLEYHGNLEHHYVRVPWQLYYLALSSKLSKWSYLNRDAQKRLNEIGDKLLNGGFKYEFSGEYISSRTYSIIYECFIEIEKNIPNSNLIFTSKIINWVKPYLTCLLYLTVILFMLYSVYKWYSNINANFADLAPEFVGYFAILILTINKKK